MRFSLFGIPIRLTAGFFLAQTAIGVAIVFLVDMPPLVRAVLVALAAGFVLVSDLIHEMGHALEARRAGAKPEVTLVWVGGVTRFIPTMSTARVLWIAAAGVAYQVIFTAPLWVALQWGWFDDAVIVEAVVRVFVYYNLLLAALNLVPLGGMDGGMILQYTLQLLGVPRPKAVLLVIYAVGGGALAIWGFTNGHVFVGLAGAYLTYAGIRSQTKQVRVENDARANPEVEQQMRRLLVAGQHEAAAARAREILETADSPEYRTYGAGLLATALRLGGDSEALAELLPTLDGTAVSAIELARGYVAVGRPHDALRLFEPEVRADPNPANLELLATIYVAAGRTADAAQVLVVNTKTVRTRAVIDIHREMADAGAIADAAAVRNAVAADRDVKPGYVATMLLAEGEADAAIALLRRDYELAATGAAAGWLGLILHAAGRTAEAEPYLDEALQAGMDPESYLWIQATLHRAGEYESAVRFGRAAVATPHTAEFANLLAYNLACSLARLDQPGEALELLMQVDTDMLLGHLPADEDLARLRTAPRYDELLARFAPAGS